MQFIDETKITIKAGDGGHGAIAFRRERYRPNGGPSGGDGGKGGDIIFKADENIGTLLDLRYKHIIAAKRGQNGGGSDCNGRGSDDYIIRVPVGTIIYNEDTNTIIGDLVKHGQIMTGAAGGSGGLGNIHFTTSSNQAPHKSTDGQEGEELNIRLELKLLADVGLVGLPSVGKSSIIARMSAAKPKIAEYPFTTLVPNLGVVQLGLGESFVMADIPGIIKGASNGAGLGIRFLKHIQRTAILLFVVALDLTEENDLIKDFEDLLNELKCFDEKLSQRQYFVVLNKADLPATNNIEPQLRKALEDRNIELLVCSAATQQGMDALKKAIAYKLSTRNNTP